MYKILTFAGIATIVLVVSFFFGLRMLFNMAPAEVEPILATVVEKEFEFSILEQGSVESSKNAEIISEVGTSRWEGVPLLEIVKEGTFVEEGDIVAKLDSSNIDLQLKTQQIAVNTAKSKLATEQSNFSAAKEEKSEFFDPQQGVFVRDMIKAENELSKSVTALKQAEQYLGHSQKLRDKGFIRLTQFEQDQNAVVETKQRVKLGRIEIELLKRGRRRKEIDFDAKIEAARVAVENAKTNLEIDTRELEKMQKMQANCTIRVPKGVKGKIVYPDRYDQFTDKKVVMEPGTKISAKQSVAIIPNPKYMQVNGQVSESRIVHVKKDQDVEITLDANAKTTVHGKVISVSQFAEKERWDSSGVNKYRVLVSIVDPPKFIRSGMNASLKIVVERKDAVLQIPVQGMFGEKDKTFCIVKAADDTWEKREVECGTISSDYACIKSGLTLGEQIVLNPRAFLGLIGEENPDAKP